MVLKFHGDGVRKKMSERLGMGAWDRIDDNEKKSKDIL